MGIGQTVPRQNGYKAEVGRLISGRNRADAEEYRNTMLEVHDPTSTFTLLRLVGGFDPQLTGDFLRIQSG